MNQPVQGEEEMNLTGAVTKRKRKFRIFESKSKLCENISTIDHEEIATVRIAEDNKSSKLNIETIVTVSRPVEMVKVPFKVNLQNEFFDREQQQDVVEMMTIKLDAYTTVASNQFGETDLFRQLAVQPSILIKNNKLMINEESVLHQSLMSLKESHCFIRNDADELNASVISINSNYKSMEEEQLLNMSKLEELELFLSSIRSQKEEFDRRIEAIDQKLQRIEFQRNLSSRKLDKSPQKQELKVFVEQHGYQVEIFEDEQYDEFVESHYLPAQLISQFLAHRKAKAAEQAIQQKKKKSIKKCNNIISQFHPALEINFNEYQQLALFINEELANKVSEDFRVNLIFRRGTTDLNYDSVGNKSDLEYKENLLFLIKTSTGKRIGGFISNCLVEQETMEDVHAFLFSLGQTCYKFKVKDESHIEAFSSSKYYLVCFSNDLMISSNCLQEESYCEWPSSYSHQNEESSNIWLAGDFQFMIEHIDIFEILPAT